MTLKKGICSGRKTLYGYLIYIIFIVYFMDAINYRQHAHMKDMHISVLGGGLAGLSVGYYATENGIPFTVYEAGDRPGGNSVTFSHGDFLFDSGALRFHDKDDEITEEVKGLVGGDLVRIDIPSLIYYNGKYIAFQCRC